MPYPIPLRAEVGTQHVAVPAATILTYNAASQRERDLVETQLGWSNWLVSTPIGDGA